jgi:hypothetical protein
MMLIKEGIDEFKSGQDRRREHEQGTSSSQGEFHPPGAHRTVRDSVPSYGSYSLAKIMVESHKSNEETI